MDFKFTADEVIAEGRVSERAVNEVRLWLPEQSEVPMIPDELIVIFLISCSNNLELTKKTIISYYDCKKNAPEIFDDRDMEREDIKLAMKTVVFSSIPKRTDENNVVHFFKLNDSNYRNFDLIAIMKVSYMLLDVAHEINPPDGLIVVIDMQGFGLMHLTKLKLGAIQKYLHFLQEGFPIKLRCIHVLNAVYFFDKILSIIKVFMKSELMEMLNVHPPSLDMNEFHEKYVPAKCLPKDYGGEMQTIEELHEVTCKQFERRQGFFQAEESLRKACLKKS